MSKEPADGRPAFVHGFTLAEQTLAESAKWKAAGLKQGEPTRLDSRGRVQSKTDLETRGWLRFLWRKSTAPMDENDDWSINGVPHEWWDRYSNAPMLNFPRFDCSESSYFILLLTQNYTPAWREVNVQILDGLIERHLAFWGAVDWLTQFGRDPRRGEYPRNLSPLIPKHLWNEYETPGWTGNGMPNPLVGLAEGQIQDDPVTAKAMLFYKGLLLLLLSIRAKISGEDRTEQPFRQAGVNDTTHMFTTNSLAKIVATAFGENDGVGLN